MANVDRKAITREILLGFWKVHILHHAGEQPVVGQRILKKAPKQSEDVTEYR